MRPVVFRNGILIDAEAGLEGPGTLVIEGDRIRGRLGPEEPPPADADWVDLDGRALAPGYLDLHYHGRFVFEQPQDLLASLKTSAASLVRQGTTAFLPTTVAWPAPELAARVGALCQGIDDAPDDAAAVLGVHLEGPWIQPAAAGAQPDVGIRPYSEAEGRDLLDRAEGAIQMVTLAPEIAGAAQLQTELARRGIVASLGHSTADARVIEEGIGLGLRHVTHLFNAMGPVHHRDLGVAGFALTDDRLSCDLICDGVHVHPRMVALAARAKRDRLMLITDCIEPPQPVPPQPGSPEPGCEARERSFGSGQVAEVDGALRLPDGTLAGSCLSLDQAVQNAVRFRAMTRAEAVAACTARPARLLGIEAERGTLRAGARADLVILGRRAEVLETWLGGRRVHAAA